MFTKIKVETSEEVVVKFTESMKIRAVYDNSYCFPTKRLPAKPLFVSIGRKIVISDNVC